MIVDRAHPEDLSGRTPGTAAMIVVGIGLIVMVIAQTVWMNRSSRDAELSALRAGAEQAGTLTDPRALSPDALLMALATEPVHEEDFLRGTSSGWGIARSSQRSAAIMTVLVVVLMIPTISLQKPELVVFAAIPIVLYAVFLAIRVVRPGGTLDQGYAAADARLSPLGLAAVERPDIWVEPRVAGDGAQVRVQGPTVLAGRRHGRDVEIRIDGRKTQTTVPGRFEPFALEGHRQRLRADGPVPDSVAAMLDSLGASPRWTSVKLAAGADGIVVTRKTAAVEQNWLYDLWLAERLAALF